MTANTIIIRNDADRERIASHIRAISLVKPWEITIKPHVARRSNAQNRLAWQWFTKVAQSVSEHTGADKDDIKEYCCRKFLTPRIVEINGDILERYETKKLDTAEMSAFMQRIYVWATSELGLILPIPEELHERK